MMLRHTKINDESELFDKKKFTHMIIKNKLRKEKKNLENA